MTTSFADYCNVKRKRNKKKEILSIVICIFGWLIFLRFALAAFFKDPKLWVLIGDPFYLTGDRVLFNLVIASIALNASVMRTLFIIGK
jgi:predicted membrane protein